MRPISIVFPVIALVATFVGVLASAGAGADARTHVVSIENMKFSPDVIHVRAGDVVVFKNRDLVPHTATAKTGKAFDSGILQSGGEWRFAPKHEGTIRYACAFHPMMEGVVIVERP
ncbi:MAG: cupredoxin family copper-binding protein [Verrucomicrobia bacterium]|nr:cupredoxin family copper-binding protein [Verrucomicrobiota bacterium]